MAKRRRGYFKHFNDASSGASISELLALRKYRIVCLFWFFCEKANQIGSPEIQINLQVLARNFGTYPKTLWEELQNSSDSYSTLFNLMHDSKSKTIPKELNIFVCKYAEYQESRGQKKTKNDSKNDPIKDKRLKIKDNRLNNQKNAAHNFELRFNPDFVAFQKILQESGLLSPKIKINLPMIYESFGNKDAALQWLNQKKQSAGFKKLKSDIEKKNWFQAVLLDEVGLIDLNKAKQGVDG